MSVTVHRRSERRYPRPEAKAVAERSYPTSEVRSGGCTLLEQL